MATIIECKKLRFNRLSYTYVGGYNVYMTKEGEKEQFLTYLINPAQPIVEEFLLENAPVTPDGCIELPADAFVDKAYPPKVILNDDVLSDLDITYSSYLKKVKLSQHIQVEAGDVLDLVYYKDVMVYSHYVEHPNKVEPVKYRVEPIYRNTHLLGTHNVIE